MKIPKKIIQTWKEKIVPDKWKSSPASIKALMPDWEYTMMTNVEGDQFVKEFFPDFYPYYMRLPYHIQRVDSFRYCYLYKYGGLYMDLDTEVVKDLTPLFEDDKDVYIAVSYRFDSYFSNYIMASVPGHPLWLEVIERIKHNVAYPSPWLIGRSLKILHTSGPMCLDFVIKRGKFGVGRLETKDVAPCDECSGICTDGAYVVNLEGGSWHNWENVISGKLYCHFRPILLWYNKLKM